MTMKHNPIIFDQETIQKTILRISHEILEKNKSVKDLVIIGIKTRGAILAERLAKTIKKISKVDVPVGALDITLYRDDLTTAAEQPIIHKTEIDFDITNRKIILVDDVLFTGRTVRSAMNALIDFGRPGKIQLAVLVDRGHRELPIRPDYVGKNLPTSLKEAVQVRLQETDGRDEVVIEE